jgi:hypothetical protein
MGAGVADLKQIELLGALRSYFARVAAWLQAGKYVGRSFSWATITRQRLKVTDCMLRGQVVRRRGVSHIPERLVGESVTALAKLRG